MISYKVQFPLKLVNGRPHSWSTPEYFPTLNRVKEEISRVVKEYAKHARVWRLTEEEIDIDKEDW